jgi:hypothetical protein
VRALAQKVSGGHFLARGRIHEFSDTSETDADESSFGLQKAQRRENANQIPHPLPKMPDCFRSRAFFLAAGRDSNRSGAELPVTDNPQELPISKMYVKFL